MTMLDDPGSVRTLPQDEDVVVSRVVGTGRYSVAVVPRVPHLNRERRGRAVEVATLLARDRGVDAWLTEDLLHFVCLVRFRE